jgi:hypothetical protein
MVKAARKLGLEGTFLRMVAAELPDACWTPTYILDDPEERVVLATAAHCCVPGCTAAAGHCLTALKVEQFVSSEMGRPYTVESVRLEGEALSVRLCPFD